MDVMIILIFFVIFEFRCKALRIAIAYEIPNIKTITLT